MTSPPLDYAAIKANCARVLAFTDGKTLLTPQEAIERGLAQVCLSLLADRARMEKALREAERELAFAVEHMGRTGGGYERALVSVRQALGASPDGK